MLPEVAPDPRLVDPLISVRAYFLGQRGSLDSLTLLTQSLSDHYALSRSDNFVEPRP